MKLLVGFQDVLRGSAENLGSAGSYGKAPVPAIIRVPITAKELLLLQLGYQLDNHVLMNPQELSHGSLVAALR